MSTTPPVPDTWDKPIHHFEVTMRAAGRREASIQTRLRHARYLARTIDASPNDVDSQRLLEWAARQQWAPETRHAYYVTFRQLFEVVGSDAAEGLPAVSRPVPPPHPTPEAVYRLALTKADERTRTILTLVGSLGLRRSEIVQVHREDLLEDLIGTSLRVHAKGGHDRVVPLTSELASLIRTMTSRNSEGWLLSSREGGHISPRWASKLASRGLPPGWSLHSLRHRFATKAYGVDRDILAVQRLLGHSSVATTQRYTAPPDDAMRRAVEQAA